jgi:hypothetical protein
MPRKQLMRSSSAWRFFALKKCTCPTTVPKGLALTRASFGPKWFQIRWAYEESNHGSRLSPISIGDRIRGGSRGGQWSKSVNRFESVANRLAAWYFPDHLVLHISGAVSPTSLSLGRSL